VLLLCAALAACGGGQTRAQAAFSTEWQDDGGEALRAALGRITAVPAPRGADVVVGLTSSGLVGASLTERTVWTYTHEVDSRPAIAGNVVVATGNGEVFALEATTGRKLWDRPAGGVLRGIGDDGKTTVLSLTRTGDQSSLVLAVDHGGSVVRQIEAAPVIGVPAVLGNHLLLPWLGSYVSIYDVTRGEEIARIVSRERVSRAFAFGGAIFVGEDGVSRLGASAVGAWIAPPARALPGEPTWFRSGFDAPPAPADARDKIRWVARPDAAGRFVALYYAFALGLDAAKGALLWVHTHGSDLLAGSAYAGGVALCDAEGNVVLLDEAGGTTTGEIRLGSLLESCVLQTDALAQPAARPPRRPLVLQLGDALSSRRADLVPMQQFLLAEVVHQPAPEATSALVDLVMDPDAPAALAADARAALTHRENGAEYLTKALERHYDYAKGVVVPPPVGVLADALVAMHETHAARLLSSHLLDPATPSGDIRKAAAALTVLDATEAAADLRTFFSLYRTGTDEDLAAAVLDVARALVRWGTAGDAALVARAVEDPFTAPAIRAGLAGAIEGARRDALPEHP
jgi:outer membrane protein assembly factor BamB